MGEWVERISGIGNFFDTTMTHSSWKCLGVNGSLRDFSASSIQDFFSTDTSLVFMAAFQLKSNASFIFEQSLLSIVLLNIISKNIVQMVFVA